MRVLKTDNRRQLVLKRRHAISNIRRLCKAGMLKPAEIERAVAVVIERYGT